MNSYRWIFFSVCLLSSAVATWQGRPRRDYYIAAVDVMWDYVPSGYNLVDNDYEAWNERMVRNTSRVGRAYMKAIFKQFTDATYSVEIPGPPWRGIVGPLISGEVGDVIFVHFKNMATGSKFSVHPHGFRYLKDSEGALYLDGTRGTDKLDDTVPPGGEYTYVWFVDGDFVPTQDDDNCIAWGYHSHTNSPKDIDSGLLGFLLTCKRGILRANGSRIDVDRELMVYADIIQESNSWYMPRNLRLCGSPRSCQTLFDNMLPQSPFKLSNDMYQLNGYTYGNGPDFDVCEGERVVIYLMSLNIAGHPIAINGQTMIINKKRTDVAHVLSAVFKSAYVTPINPGRWLMYCRNQNHYRGGMRAYFNVHRCNFRGRPPVPPSGPIPGFVSTRRYFIAAEEILWDYAPSATGQYPTERMFLRQSATRIGSVYKKAVFREYYDQSFTYPKQRGPNEVHYGLAGPPIKAEVGDNVEVVFMNKASRPYSILFNGIVITKSNEGHYYKNFRQGNALSGAVAEPGGIFVYRFYVPHTVSPTVLDPECITYIYHSAYGDALKDIYTGLFGPLIVCKPGVLEKRQVLGVREFYVNWQVIYENRSWYIDDNIELFANLSVVNKRDSGFQRSNQMRAINGRSFGTLEGLHMCAGDIVIWHMYGLGTSFDHHQFTFDSNSFMMDGRNIDTATLAGLGRTVSMVPDQIGTHLLRTSQLGYEREGMFAFYHVDLCQSPSTRTGRNLRLLPPGPFKSVLSLTRRYFIGAIEVDWEYIPNKIDPADGSSLLNPESPAFIFVRKDNTFIGSRYIKAIYREFTDESFTVQKMRGPEEVHLAMQGPFIRSSVGDLIEIVFANFASFPFNIVPRNFITADGTSISTVPATQPGTTRVYRYRVPERSVPGPKEPNCVGTLYTSRVRPLNDTYSGLFGTAVICRKGILDIYGRRTDDVHREFSTAWVIMDENGSNYQPRNILLRAPARRNIGNSTFQRSNRMDSVNGQLYGNLQGLDMRVGEKTVWYLVGFGSIFDIHGIHWHGQLVLRRTQLAIKRDVIKIFPGNYETVEMLNTNPGSWLLHCHVGLHTRDGMKAVYNVLPRM